MEAGYRRIAYLAWSGVTYPSMRIATVLESLNSGWPAEVLEERYSEFELAKLWLEGQARKERTRLAESALETAKANDAGFGPLLTSSEAQKLLQEEIEDGRPVTLKAFEQALRRAARKARTNPDILPLSLGGQHEDWQLVELASESGGHGNGHRLRRRQGLHQG